MNRSLYLMVRKDAYTAYILLRTSLVICIALWVIFTVWVPTMSVFYAIIACYGVTISLFSVEENQGNTDINHMLPVSRNDQITARYVFAWVTSLAITVITGLMLAASSLLFHRDAAVLSATVLIAAFALFMINFTFPVIYRFGILKTRIYSFIVYFVAIMLSGSLSALFASTDFASIHLTSPAFELVLLACMALFSPVSLLISQRWAANR
ncbi:ABC-2 transporter permease [Ruminococcaceae bacterium OttesenSCG-928-L11]|nr:ABC-2 transporter permease [Ruminococcaceae bacterium OttesenSCG-928-L11]